MDKLQLKINDQWCVLDEDTSISIEMTSPLWNDSGDFSYPFTLPYSANKHIFNAAEVPESDVNLKTFKERFELYIDGYGILFGNAVCTSDEIDTEEDSVELELRASTGSFDDAIDDVSLQDLDLSDADFGYVDVIYDTYYDEWNSLRVDENISDEWCSTIVNTNKIYPEANYCNISVIVNESESSTPVVLSPYRYNTSPNFFVLYILKKIFHYAGYSYDEEAVMKTLWMEDFKRLIIINTNFDYEYDVDDCLEKRFIDFDGGDDEWAEKYKMIAGGENLPDEDASSFIDALKNAFGLRLVFDDSNKTVRFILLRDVFRSTDAPIQILHGYIQSAKKAQNSWNGVVVKYSETSGDEFDYDDFKHIEAYDSYTEIYNVFNKLSHPETDVVLRIDRSTGNYYRTKVDSSSYEDGAMFEVAQFVEYEIENPETSTDGEDQEEIEIGFTPIIPTPTTNTKKYNKSFEMPKESYFVDVTITGCKTVDYYTHSIYDGYHSWNSRVGAALDDLMSADNGFTLGILRTTPEGSLADGYTDITEDVDGFGNAQWIQTTSDNTVTSDSLTTHGKVYDYNGTDDGTGVELNEYISLKLWANKTNFDAKYLSKDGVKGTEVFNNNPTGILPNRGLVHQFLYEYLHFLQYRKEVEYVLEMEPSVIAQIQWDKFYEIDGKRCLINSVSYDVTKQGVGMCTLDVYFI